MDITTLIIQLISGAAGGNIAGALFKKINLGILMNSIAGIIGGPLGGFLLKLAGVAGAGAAAAGGADAVGLDIMSILKNVGAGGAGGGVLMAIIGLIKQMMAQPK